MEIRVEEEKELAKAEESAASKPGENTEEVIDNAVPETDREEDANNEQPQAPHTMEEENEAPPAVQQKQDNVLNLNNEVVKMRKEVKRVRALVIRKLARQIGVLKKKKGKDADLERNQRRAARLLEEIHAIKTLVPDKVTKTALQQNLNFEQVCKDPKSSISDRALARIATYPQFSKKILDIKAAVKDFKEERSKEEKQSGKMQKKNEKTKNKSPQTDTEKKSNKAEEKTAVMKLCETDSPVESSFIHPTIKVEQIAKEKETPQKQNKHKTQSPVKHIERSKQQIKSVEKKTVSKLSEVPLKSDEESDLEFSDGEEKEYFDDSTEERFHKQSSAESEESDNDFFVGKVSKFKKKKKTKNTEDEKVQKSIQEKTNPPQSDKIQSELDELESRLKSKVPSLNSVFCTSLARSKTGKSAGKSDRKTGGKVKCKDDASKEFKDVSKQSKGKGRDLDSKWKPSPGNKASGTEQKYFGGKGHMKEFARQKDTRGRSMFSHQAPAQPLHPSWEASKKRKEQQSQILAFQGKKIKFDDD